MPADEAKPADKSQPKEKRVIGPFVLEKRIGVGGMGIVYLATYTKTNRKVALKLLSPSLSTNQNLLARFEREMSILKKLKHKHIVKYYGGGKYKNQNFYAMELLTGGTLEEELKKSGKLPWERCIEVGVQICSALEHAHELGIIHRDLKPANLFLTKKGDLKLGDFGIARDTQDTALTAAGRTVGTYSYMAPEQIMGKPPVSRKTDIYALGCVLYELLTGHPPFESDNQADMFMMHLNNQPDTLRSFGIDCPVWLDTLVLRMLEKDPDDRPHDALAVEMALKNVKNKVAEQHVATQMMPTSDGEGPTKEDVVAIKKAAAKKKKQKKKQDEPFYEKIWFLASCLILLIAVMTWLLWPMSEKELIAKIEAGMAPELTLQDWRDTRDDYIYKYLERFPDGEYTEQAQDHIDHIEMRNAELRLERALERGREPETAHEKQYLAARRKAKLYTDFGDHRTPSQFYQQIVDTHKDNEEAEPIVNLARRDLLSLKEEGGETLNRTQFLKDQLKTAEDHFQAGERGTAREIWRTIIDLYEDLPDYALQVEEAHQQMTGRGTDD